MSVPITEQETSLLIETARAHNTGALLRVVDESTRRAAELREEREARRQEERAAEARRDRAEEAERIEREHADRLAERHRVEARGVVDDLERVAALRREAEARARLKAADRLDLLA